MKTKEEILERVNNIERMSANMEDSYVLKRVALRAMQEYADQFQPSEVMPSNEEIENQLLTRFGFKGYAIDAGNQLKIFSFMDWFKSYLKPAE